MSTVGDILLQVYPWAVALGVVVVFIAALRLDRRMSRGAHSAGPADVPRPAPPGQAEIPWELEAIEGQLRLAAGRTSLAVQRYDLTATVNRLLVAAGLTGAHHQLPMTATEDQLDHAITLIERQLELPPLEGRDPR